MYSLEPISHLYKQIVLALSIVETLLGLTNIGMGISFVLESNYLTVIWIIGGVWIFVTGLIGIFSGTSVSNACLVNNHMSFCISSALGSAGLASLGIIQSRYSEVQLFPITPLIPPGDIRLLAVGVLDCFVVLLCTISASFCCALNSSFGYSGACGGCICVNLEQPAHTETDRSTAQNVPYSLPYNNTHLLPRITQIKYDTNQV